MPMNLARDQIIVERRFVAVFGTVSDESLTSLTLALPDSLRDPFARAVGLRRGAYDSVLLGAMNFCPQDIPEELRQSLETAIEAQIAQATGTAPATAPGLSPAPSSAPGPATT